jgi:probable O-glycosylation ligase (exosortase A-associated)
MLLNPGAVNTNDIPLLGDNNGVAVGMFMLAPLFIALARTAGTRWEKLICQFSTIGVLYRGLSTFSRGGFLACGALGFHYFVRSNRKFVSILVIAVICVLIAPVLSEEYWERIGTITTATDKPDESGEGRLHFWRTALLMADDRPLTGVGTRAYSAMYDHYDTSAGEYGAQRAVHSSWFGILAELGYPGLLLFILIVGYAFVVCRRARRAAHRSPELVNLAAYAIAIEGSLVAFIVGGTFVHFQYVEILWHTLALSAVIDRLVSDRLKALATAPPPAVELTSAAPRLRPVIRPLRA